MKSPVAAWRRGTRWPLLSLGLVGVLVVAVLICEAVGWPFLVGPVQRTLARTLDREVVFGRGADDPGVRIGLLGSVRVTASSLRIGAPAWSKEAHTVVAEDARLRLGYGDLFRAWRGGRLHVSQLVAAKLDVVLERREDGNASWQFGKKAEPDPNEKPTALPTFGTLEVGQGRLAYRDAVVPMDLNAQYTLSEEGGVVSGARFGERPSGPDASASDPATGASDAASAGAGAASAPNAFAARSASAPAGVAIRAGRPALSASSAFALAKPGEPTPRGLQLLATGRYKKLPVHVELRSAGITNLFSDDAAAVAQPVALWASIGRADLVFRGTATDPIRFRGLQGVYSIDGPSLAAAGEPLGITLPTTPPFALKGTLTKDGEIWKTVVRSASIGSSRLTAALTYDPTRARDARGKVPILAGRIGGSRLVLADLGPAVGAPTGEGTTPATASVPAPKGDRVIPSKAFDLPSLRAMDANVVFDVAYLDLGTPVLQPFRPIRTHLVLTDGVLTLGDIDAATAQGRMRGYLQLDGRQDAALWTADLRLLDVRLEQFLNLERGNGKPAYVAGRMDAQVKVKGRGKSTADILGSLDGDMRLRLRQATLSHLIAEAGGLDIAQALGLIVTRDNPLPIRCNVADLDLAGGVIRPKVFVLNTDDSTIWLDGRVSLRDESMDLRMVTAPKDFSPLALRTPVRVGGTLGDPKVSIEMGRLAGKAGAAALLALLHPLAALVPFIDTGNREDAEKADAQCASLVKTSGAIAPPVTQPAAQPAKGPAVRPASAPAR
jgi:uncharacterized protein involved in outer membrane biogenesis